MSKFRPNANNGVWCSLLVPLALYDSFTGETIPDLKKVTFLISCAMSLVSLHFAFNLIYIPRSEGKGVLNHMMQVTVSDLFERKTSKEVRLRRKSQIVVKDPSSSSPSPTRTPSRTPSPKPTPKRLSPAPPQSLYPTQTTLSPPSIITHAAPEVPQKSGLSGLSGTLLVCLVITVLILMSLLKIQTRLPVLIFAAFQIYCYTVLLPRVFETFPGSFTFGEGCVVTQSALLFLFEATTSLLTEVHSPTTITGSFSIIGLSGLLSCVALAAMPKIPGLKWTSFIFVTVGILILFGVTLPYLWVTLKRDPITWTLDVIMSNNKSSGLLAIWTLLVVASVIIVLNQTAAKSKANTRTRKIFHGIMVIVFTSGIILDPNFTFLASIVAFSVLLLLEAFRLYDIAPFSTSLTKNLSLFLDDKDQGKLILTHMYLLVGCSCPLWLVHDLQDRTLTVKILSGVLSIGLGDSAASVFGSKFGRLKFPDSQKSVEGTLASIVTQLGFLWALDKLAFITVTSWTQYILPIIIASLVEALTNQVDNLVLPLLLYILF